MHSPFLAPLAGAAAALEVSKQEQEKAHQTLEEKVCEMLEHLFR